MIKNLLTLFCLLCFSQAPAQKKGQALIDSMVQVLPALKEDSNKVNHFLILSKQFYNLSKLKEGIAYGNLGLSLAERINWENGIAKCYNQLGVMVSDTGNNVQARMYFEKSLEINRKTDSKLNIINNLNNIGRAYQHESDFSNAVEYFFRALKMAEEIKNSEKIALVGTNITATYILQQNYPKAEEYAKITLENAKIARAPQHTATALQHLGIVYIEMHDTIKAKEYFNSAIEVYRGAGILGGEIECMLEISNLEMPEESLKTLLEVQDKLDKDGSLFLLSLGNLGSIGMTYYNVSKSKIGEARNEYLLNAERYLRRGLNLARESKNAENVAAFSMRLSKVEEDKGNLKEALALNKEYHSINDSIYSQDNKNKIATLESKKTLDLKDKEIQINKLVISNQTKTQLGLIAGLCLLGIIGGLLLWQNKTRKKTNTTLMVLNNQLDEANKVKAKFFAILSHDLRSPISNLVNFLHLQKESPGTFTEKQAAANEQKISSSADSLLETMEAMLLWSKGQMENFKPQIKMVPVSSLFEHLKQFFSGTENVSIQYEQQGGIIVSTDENYLQTIMHNLTSNSIKALKNSPNASIKWLAKQEGGQVLLSITDNGPGVNEEQVKALNDNSDVVNTKTGFGLHIIRDLAKAIKCRISVQSGGDGGTTFVLAV